MKDTNQPDFSEKWNRWKPVEETTGVTRRDIEDWGCSTKHFTLKALGATGARYTQRGGSTEIAWAYPARDEADRLIIPAIKRRRVDGDDQTPRNEAGSKFVEPLILRPEHARRTIICEGETDAAWLWQRFPDAQIIALPGATSWRPEWVKWIPAGASVRVALDNDVAGHKGAAKVGRSVWNASPRDVARLLPPGGANDWCDCDA